MNIAFLGLGKMGAAVAALLLNAGHELSVWNRSAEKAAALVAHGARIAKTPTEAVRTAEAVFTMLNDDVAVDQIVFGSEAEPGILKALRPGAIHVSLSTISVELSQRLTAGHTAAGSQFVAAPVFGRPNVAAEGKLWTVVGGSPAAVDRVRPLLEAFSRGITIVSEKPSAAHALKIGGNFLITAMIESLSEATVFAGSQGIDPAVFLETANHALFRSPFYEAYSKLMLDPPDPPGGTIALGNKDMGLFRAAAQEAGMLTPLGDRFAADLDKAIEAGLQDEDWAAGLYRLAQSVNLPKR